MNFSGTPGVLKKHHLSLRISGILRNFLEFFEENICC
jgi:hypothetical protein